MHIHHATQRFNRCFFKHDWKLLTTQRSNRCFFKHDWIFWTTQRSNRCCLQHSDPIAAVLEHDWIFWNNAAIQSLLLFIMKVNFEQRSDPIAGVFFIMTGFFITPRSSRCFFKSWVEIINNTASSRFPFEIVNFVRRLIWCYRCQHSELWVKCMNKQIVCKQSSTS